MNDTPQVTNHCPRCEELAREVEVLRKVIDLMGQMALKATVELEKFNKGADSARELLEEGK